MTAFDIEPLATRITEGFDAKTPQGRFSRNLVSVLTTRDQVRWRSSLGDSNKFEAISVAMAKNAVIAVARYQVINRAVPQYFLTALRADTGQELFQAELPDEPLPGGLIVDRDGNLLVVMLDGGVACFGK